MSYGYDGAVRALWKLEPYYCPSEGTSCGSNNGNVVSQKLRVNNGALVLATAYGYDGMNRITSATEKLDSLNGTTTWSQGFSYGDQYGNLTQIGDGGNESIRNDGWFDGSRDSQFFPNAPLVSGSG